ncbi:metalloregulator ArsR/SmtB family transcription factor [Vibrio sp. ZSDZ34]|jgi:DNA-binding transcriptional ArsR family regulator|uniref:Metalloregulator ArsR/SmtB family transcription factor n=1 Tax=Vibrio gelatinilyticus TaxID=2893468 RepID=A0A9X1WAT7_9VIBR|nr:metalloregulator ArsR/SmtB family transcription factor [Vibrio gelatinilyticus]MCJ2377178.1 metalloregulator ArsR/SmtB family transcription factor [Vibrio gelatinilyticus]
MYESMQVKSQAVSEVLKSMAHPERLMVLCQLVENELCVQQLQANSSLSQSAFSQQLKVLRDHNLVSIRKQSQNVYYSLADDKIKLLIKTLYQTYCH